MTRLGVTFPPDQPPERLEAVARAADVAGLDELWLWEDCFAESGVAPAAAVLAWTSRITVGIGLMPVPLRNVALAAMEIAALARLFPGRVLPGIGHGVLQWMGQVGARVESPLTLLEEYGTALRRLLDGEKVEVAGRYVTLDGVQLRWPPAQVPVLVGAEGPKTLAVAGRVGDGVILLGGPEGVRAALALAQEARDAAGVTSPLDVVSFLSVPVGISADELAVQVDALAAAGADRITVCGLAGTGEPDGTERILDLVATVAEVARR